jgi:glycosyltransferase involved in cell wall biosynthesis
VRAVYITYDGLLDPLGRSQVVPYVLGLAERGVGIEVISYEKPNRLRAPGLRGDLAAELVRRHVGWAPLTYHRRPRLPSTLWDVCVGARLTRSVAKRSRPDLVHCRGEVPMVMARWAGLPHGTRLLLDVRGFFSDERVESGSWARGGLVDRVVRRIESRNLARADGIVALTEAGRRALGARRDPLPPHRVIPTCADLEVFIPRPADRPPDFGLAYCGSLGSWYMTSEMVAFARIAARRVPGRVLFLTPHAEAASREGASPDWSEIRGVEAGEVAAWLRRTTALFFFIRPTPAKRASCPTKLGQALACGLPVVCNRGIGDLDVLIEDQQVGVLVDAFADESYARAADRLARLLEDRGLPARCRALAERRFALETGIRAYESLYRELVGPGTRGT